MNRNLNAPRNRYIQPPFEIPRRENEYAHIPFGDVPGPKNEDTVRIYFQNNNGIKSNIRWLSWCDALKKSLDDLQVDILGCAETKIEWTNKDRQQATSYAKSQFGHATIATSNSDYSVGYKHQPGGTATLLTKKVSSRYHSRVNDPSGLGRWSGFKLHAKENKYIHILTAYCPCANNKHAAQPHSSNKLDYIAME
jgi:hypothetical protein